MAHASVSPYTAYADNPISYIDTNGLNPEDFIYPQERAAKNSLVVIDNWRRRSGMSPQDWNSEFSGIIRSYFIDNTSGSYSFDYRVKYIDNTEMDIERFAFMTAFKKKMIKMKYEQREKEFELWRQDLQRYIKIMKEKYDYPELKSFEYPVGGTKGSKEIGISSCCILGNNGYELSFVIQSVINKEKVVEPSTNWWESGAGLFARMFVANDGREVDSLIANWKYGSNLSSFSEARIKQNKEKYEAALSTFTGKMAQRFYDMDIIDEDIDVTRNEKNNSTIDSVRAEFRPIRRQEEESSSGSGYVDMTSDSESSMREIN